MELAVIMSLAVHSKEDELANLGARDQCEGMLRDKIKEEKH